MNHELHYKQPSKVLSDLRAFKDCDVVVTIERATRKRSLNQNAYYWGIMIPLVRQGLTDAGYRITQIETHELLKSMFAKAEHINQITGEVLVTTGSTAQMTTSQMMDYFAEITQWAAEYLEVQVPQPNEQLTIEIQ